MGQNLKRSLWNYFKIHILGTIWDDLLKSEPQFGKIIKNIVFVGLIITKNWENTTKISKTRWFLSVSTINWLEIVQFKKFWSLKLEMNREPIRKKILKLNFTISISQFVLTNQKIVSFSDWLNKKHYDDYLMRALFDEKL